VEAPEQPRGDGRVWHRGATGCGVLAGPLFVSVLTALGRNRAGYDWRRHAVSSLAAGHGGWGQRANFIVTGALYCVAARDLARSATGMVGPLAVPRLVWGAGFGLLASGAFVTDPVAGFPPPVADRDDAPTPSTMTGQGALHN
jgi:hypothetical protein